MDFKAFNKAIEKLGIMIFTKINDPLVTSFDAVEIMYKQLCIDEPNKLKN
jgi:hypothetical protein